MMFPFPAVDVDISIRSIIKRQNLFCKKPAKEKPHFENGVVTGCRLRCAGNENSDGLLITQLKKYPHGKNGLLSLGVTYILGASDNSVKRVELLIFSRDRGG